MKTDQSIGSSFDKQLFDQLAAALSCSCQTVPRNQVADPALITPLLDILIFSVPSFQRSFEEDPETFGTLFSLKRYN